MLRTKCNVPSFSEHERVGVSDGIKNFPDFFESWDVGEAE
jgi:hypothetical protein